MQILRRGLIALSVLSIPVVAIACFFVISLSRPLGAEIRVETATPRVGPPPRPGGFAVFDAATGRELRPWPSRYEITAVVPDGAGGWYVGGGTASGVYGLGPNLARITANGEVDESWAPQGIGWVHALAFSGGRLYVCAVSGTATNHDEIISLDAATGATIWKATVVRESEHTPFQYSCALLAAGDRLYAGGEFTEVAAEAPSGDASSTLREPRRGLAAFDAATGALLPWRPELALEEGGAVRALALDGRALYVGGTTRQQGDGRGLVASVDPESGEVQDWDLWLGMDVLALALSDGQLYIGGRANPVGGMLIAADASSATELPWEPELNLEESPVTALGVQDDRLYVGLQIFVPDEREVRAFVALDAGNGASLLWAAGFPGSAGVQTLSASGPHVAIAGNFSLPGDP